MTYLKNYISFLNHSCVQIKGLNTKILCDPWFEGSAFSNGWSLVYDNSHNINDIEFDYIWISHEHPDHFSIPTLKKLNKGKKFLYQKTIDKKVKLFLEKLGHEVIELPNKEPVKLGDLVVTSVVCDGFDSSLLVKFNDGKVLVNINDARVDLNNHLENDIIPLLDGRRVDVLMFQFSYANWAGNPGDFDIAKHQQFLVDKKNEYAISKLSPKVIMPFASFVYFSHEENFYWNQYNWLSHIYSKYKNFESKLFFPKPNQIMFLDEVDIKDFSIQNNVALEFWQKLYNQIEKKYFSKTVPIDKMRVQYNIFLDELYKKNLIFTSKNKGNFFLKIKILDLDIVIEVGLNKKSFKILEESKDNIVCEVSSETFIFLFSQLFARGTVIVNSRIKFNYNLAHRFFLYFIIPYRNNLGDSFNGSDMISKKLFKSIANISVMKSIAKYNNESKLNMVNDIDNLLSLFDVNLNK